MTLKAERPSGEDAMNELERFLQAAFDWIDSRGFDTPRRIRGLAAAINAIRYTDHERTPKEIVAALARPAEPCVCCRASGCQDPATCGCSCAPEPRGMSEREDDDLWLQEAYERGASEEAAKHADCCVDREELARLRAAAEPARALESEHAALREQYRRLDESANAKICKLLSEIADLRELKAEPARGPLIEALEATGVGQVALTSIIDGHDWVERDGVVWCQWCGVPRVEVPDWTDHPQCPAIVLTRRALAQLRATSPQGREGDE